MRRGEVWLVNFGASSGGERRKPRPAIIVSNDAANQDASRIQVVPLSSKTGKLYPYQTRVTVAGMESKALADQIMSVSKERLVERLGSLVPDHIRRVDMAIRIQLGLAI
jgi:mRNA interferase MazF